jgi:hypothetical protein
VFPEIQTSVSVPNTTSEVCDNKDDLVQSYNQALETVSNLSFTTTITKLGDEECTPEGICWACYPVNRRRLLATGVQISFKSLSNAAVAPTEAPTIKAADVIATLSYTVIPIQIIISSTQVQCINSDALQYGCEELIIDFGLPPPPASSSAGVLTKTDVTIVVACLLAMAVMAFVVLVVWLVKMLVPKTMLPCYE